MVNFSPTTYDRYAYIHTHKYHRVYVIRPPFRSAHKLHIPMYLHLHVFGHYLAHKYT
ncbi:hypothetical protein BROC_02423 [Candidatus Brocadiaceae bacterium]|nr:hypothetical protein BROC_02423 [Candidatus Brocadiaceae bacterium]